MHALVVFPHSANPHSSRVFLSMDNLYIATYSAVDVYELMIDGTPLMRRVLDDWVNATQILKIAQFPKAQRTKILERDIQKGTHEKIQGGYGRFQGTWVPLAVAQQMAEQYGIAGRAPVLQYTGGELPRRGRTSPRRRTQRELNTPVPQHQLGPAPVLRQHQPPPQPQQQPYFPLYSNYGIPSSPITPRPSYAQQLLHFFSSDDQPIPGFMVHPPPAFDINAPIDDEGHTPLHWAALMANVKLLELILHNGGDALRTNMYGLNALAKMVAFNNLYDLQNFGQVVHLLSSNIYAPDPTGKTPIHHVCQHGRHANKIHACLYYLTEMLDRVVQDEMVARQLQQRAQLLHTVLNHQDAAGDTALHIALRNGSEVLCLVLVRYGAKVLVVNMQHELPEYLMRSFEAELDNNSERTLEETLPLRRGPQELNLTSDFEHIHMHEANKENALIKPEPSDQLKHTPPPLNLLPYPIQATHSTVQEMFQALGQAMSDERDGVDRLLAEAEQLLARIEAEHSEVSSQLKGKDLSAEQLDREVHKLRQQLEQRTQALTRMYERGQAFSLAGMIKEEEAGQEEHEEEGQPDMPQYQQVLRELTQLQLERQNELARIVRQLLERSLSSRMQQYRKLVLVLCGVKAEEVDGLLDGIALALTQGQQDELQAGLDEVGAAEIAV